MPGEVWVLPLEKWRGLMPVRDFKRLTAVMEDRLTGAAVYFGTWDWDT